MSESSCLEQFYAKHKPDTPNQNGAVQDILIHIPSEWVPETEPKAQKGVGWGIFFRSSKGTKASVIAYIRLVIHIITLILELFFLVNLRGDFITRLVVSLFPAAAFDSLLGTALNDIVSTFALGKREARWI